MAERGTAKNSDGSVDVYFGPTTPKGLNRTGACARLMLCYRIWSANFGNANRFATGPKSDLFSEVVQ